MKKKTLLGLFMSTLLILGACSDKEENLNTTPEKQINNDIVENENVTYKDLNIEIKSKLREDSSLYLLISLENKSETMIPFYLQENQMMKVNIYNESNKIIAEKTITESDRNKIQSGEKVFWEDELNLSEKAFKFKIEVQLLLIDQEKEKYDTNMLKRVLNVNGNKLSLDYLPEEKMKYVYEYFDGEEKKEIYEEFIYFDGNLVQSVSNLFGTRIYKSDENGFHIVYMNEFKEVKEDILNKTEEDEITLIKAKAKENDEWKADGEILKVLRNKEVVATPYHVFENVTRIKADNYEYLIEKTVGIIQVYEDGKLKMRLKDIIKTN